MNRILIVPLVLTLSGVPAAAVVCDLLFCDQRTNPVASQSGCHDHLASQSGRQLAPHAGGCAHLSAADLYLASGSRLVLHPVVSPPVESIPDAAAIAVRPADRTQGHGPPLGVTSSIPLRI